MPRVYKRDPGARRYKTYDPHLIRQAIEEYATSENMSLSKISNKYNIKKSVLHRHSKGIMKKQGGQKALSDETESYLIEQINEYTDLGYPLDTIGLRYTVKTYLDKLGIKHKRFKNNTPGPDFVNSFLQRHKNVISQQVFSSVSTDTIKEYFNKLEKSLDGVPTSNIISYDKIYLPSIPDQSRVLIEHINKSPERIPNNDIGSISVIIAGTADGRMLPSYVISKDLHLKNSSIRRSEYTQCDISTSGWLNGTNFEGWIKDVVIPYCQNVKGKKCLIGDSLWSHFSDDLIHDFKELNINFVPSSSTYVKQPANVVFYRRVRYNWKKLLLSWRTAYGSQSNTISEGYLHEMLTLLFNSIYVNASNNIITGFETTGIYPLNVNQMLSSIPNGNVNEDSRFSNEIKVSHRIFDESVVDDKMMQNNSTNVITSKGRRRFVVPISKSVIEDNAMDHDDFHIENPEPVTKKRKKGTVKNEVKKELENNNETFTEQVDESKIIDLQKLLDNPSDEVFLIIVGNE